MSMPQRALTNVCLYQQALVYCVSLHRQAFNPVEGRKSELIWRDVSLTRLHCLLYSFFQSPCFLYGMMCHVGSHSSGIKQALPNAWEVIQESQGPGPAVHGPFALLSLLPTLCSLALFVVSGDEVWMAPSLGPVQATVTVSLPEYSGAELSRQSPQAGSTESCPGSSNVPAAPWPGAGP